ncbi:histidine kinase [Tenacibaculum sp. ZS6-P6]|uniref:sensor histidine kinase n=1 Tax=Tenacibaculum sp. ZS6-P6 TaxID=3447503 RepID=UPI003F9C5C1C
MHTSKKILNLLLLLFSVVVIAQYPVFTQLTEKSGLPDVEFYDVVEDREGFIWLAADKGLFRYDGKEFKNYSHPDKRGLSVFGLKLDSQGKVWCNNVSGQFFYVNKDKLILFKDLKEETKGKLTNFIFYKNKLIVYNYRGIIFVNINNPMKMKIKAYDDLVRSVYVDHDSLFYHLGKNKFYSKDAENFSIVKEYENELYSEFPYMSWYYLSFKEEKFFLGVEKLGGKVDKTNNRVLVVENDRFINVNLPDIIKYTPIINYYKYQNLLWLATENGVFSCEYKDRKITIKQHFLKGQEVSKIIKDRNDNYWYTTLNNGIFIVPNIFLREFDLETEEKNITAIIKIDENKILIGSYDGELLLIDIKNNKKSKINSPFKEKIFGLVMFNDKKVIVSYKAHTVLLDIENFTSQDITNNLFAGVKDFSLIENNKLLIALYNGAIELNFKGEKQTVRTLGNIRSYTTFYSEKYNNKYVGYVDGVRMYDENFTESEILHNERNVFAVDIDETANGIVWLSTFKNGIYGLDKDSVIINYNTGNGLLSDLTREIKGDGDNLWISTNKGIQVLNTKTNEIKNLTRKDGINSYNISDIITLNDELIFSSNKGVFVLDKEKIFKRKSILNFYFTDILINNEKVAKKKVYKLRYDENKLQFNFHCNGFLAQENVKYSYKLSTSKNKENWNKLDKNINQITFNSLAAGDYVFTLKATDLNDDNQEFERVIKFTIALPFYKEWWFVISVFLLGVLFIWYRFNIRLKRVNTRQEVALEKARLQKELVSTKLETLRSQMNPHFTFNALNSIQNLILKNDKQEAYNYLTKFSSLIRENLHLSTQNFVVFEQELSLINRYLELEKLRFKDNFIYQIILGEDVEEVKIPTMIIQPYVENAIKHGLLHKKEGVKRIKIEFYISEGVLVSKIYDNGIGIKRSKEIQKANGVKRKSFSTKSIQERLLFLRDYYKTDIGVEYPEVKEGTMVVIKIPYLS